MGIGKKALMQEFMDMLKQGREEMVMEAKVQVEIDQASYKKAKEQVDELTAPQVVKINTDNAKRTLKNYLKPLREVSEEIKGIEKSSTSFQRASEAFSKYQTWKTNIQDLIPNMDENNEDLKEALEIIREVDRVTKNMDLTTTTSATLNNHNKIMANTTKQSQTMIKAIKKYNEMMAAAGYYHHTIGTGNSQGTEDWDFDDMVNEAHSVLSTYYEPGHENNHLKTDNFKEWKSQTEKLKRFVMKYVPYMSEMLAPEDYSPINLNDVINLRKQREFDAGKFTSFQDIPEVASYIQSMIHMDDFKDKIEQLSRNYKGSGWNEFYRLVQEQFGDINESNIEEFYKLLKEKVDYNNLSPIEKFKQQTTESFATDNGAIAQSNLSRATDEYNQKLKETEELLEVKNKLISEGADLEALNKANQTYQESSEELLKYKMALQEAARVAKTFNDNIQLPFDDNEIFEDIAFLKETNSKAAIEKLFAKSMDYYSSLGQISVDDDVEDIKKETGALEDKLEVLRDIAEQYGNNITQKNRDRYEELNQKDMNDGLTSREEDRFWELGEKITTADESLEEFGATYDKIILKLANGKKVEILPDDAGLRKMAEFADGWGSEYKGIEIEDVLFVRKQELDLVEQTNDALEEKTKLEAQAAQEARKAAEAKMTEAVALLGRLQSDYADRFDSIFGSTMKEFGSGITIDNAEAFYNALMAKEKEYQDMVAARVKAVADFNTSSQEIVGQYVGTDSYDDVFKTFSVLSADILEGKVSLEEANVQLNEFIGGLKKADVAEEQTISSYEDLVSVVEKYITLCKQIKPMSTPEFDAMDDLMWKESPRGDKADFISAIKARYTNMQRIKASQKNGLSIYKHMDDDGEEYEYDIDNYTLDKAEKQLQGSIYSIVANYGYELAEATNDFTQKRMRSFVEKEIEKYLNAQAASGALINENRLHNEQIEDAMEEVEDRLYRMAKDEKSYDRVSSALSHLRDGDLNRYGISYNTQQISSAIGIYTPYDEIAANATKIETYEDLCNVIERYNELRKKLYTNTENFLSEDEEKEWVEIQSRLSKTKSGYGKFVDPWDGIEDINKFAQAIGIEIPTAADKAEQAVEKMNNELHETNQTVNESKSQVTDGLLGDLADDFTDNVFSKMVDKPQIDTSDMEEATQSAEETAKAADKEKKALEGVAPAAEKAGKAKGKFTDANKKANKSAQESTEGFKGEKKALDDIVESAEEAASGLDKVKTSYDSAGDPLYKTAVSSETTDKAVITRSVHSEWNNDIGDWSRSGEDVIKDFKKRAEQLKKESAKIELAKKTVQKFLTQFESKTANQAGTIDAYNTLKGFSINNLNDIETATKLMLEMDAEYNKITTSFRKGTKSMNPFVNAITGISDMEDKITDVKTAFGQLENPTQELKGKIDGLDSLLANVKANLGIDEQGKVYITDIYALAEAYGNLNVALRDVQSGTKVQKHQEALAKKNAKASQQELAQQEKDLKKLRKLQKDQATAAANIVGYRAQLTSGNLGPAESRLIYSKIAIEQERINSIQDEINSKYKHLYNQEEHVLQIQRQRRLVLEEIAATQERAAKKQASTATSKNKNIDIDLDQQVSVLTKQQAQWEKNGQLTDELRQKINEMFETLVKVTDSSELAIWKKQWAILRNEVMETKYQIEAADKAQKAAKDAIETERNTSGKYWDGRFKDSIDGLVAPDERPELKQLKDYMIQQNKNVEHAIKLQDKLYNTRKQLAGKDATSVKAQELSRLIVEQEKEYKLAVDLLEIDEQRNIVQERENQLQAELLALQGQSQKKQQQTYGTTIFNREGRYFTDVNTKMASLGEDGMSTMLSEKFAAYKVLLTSLTDLYRQFEATPNMTPSDELKNKFQSAAWSAENLRKEILGIYKEHQKLAQIPDDALVGVLDSKSVDISNLKRSMVDFASTVTDGKFQFESFSTSGTEMYGTLDKGHGVIQKITVALDRSTGALYAYEAGTKQTASAWKKLGNGIQGGIKRLAGMYLGFQDLIRVTRQGITYVKEIDLAMTELKKVTNETDVVYKNFLNTAAETSAVIGSTISDFTNATANFARLGYTMEESTKMAETAIVYKNVADGLDTIEESTDSIISTMMAFGIQADDTMSIIDRFNAIGNSFAITSAGIGEAMQRSASALKEGGNTIDESIALITGANSVIQDPIQVGTALKTLSLRIRGVKTDLEDAGLETEGMAETTAQLQAKLKALTHGEVDIMLNADEFKSTTQILREMADAWEHMTDVERAAALELIGGKRQAKCTNCPNVQKCA